MDCIWLGFPVLHDLSEFAQTHVHWVGDAITKSEVKNQQDLLTLNNKHIASNY